MKLPVALCLLLALAVRATAMDSFDSKVADMLLLQSKPLQHSLGVTEKQRGKMNEWADYHRKRVNAYLQDLKKRHVDTSKIPQPDRNLVLFFSELRNGVLSQLSASQLRRLREVTLQVHGPSAIADDSVAARIGLSPKQLAGVRKLVVDTQQRIKRITRNAQEAAVKPYEARRPKSQAEAETLKKQIGERFAVEQKKIAPRLRSLAQKLNAGILALLSPPQRATWQSLVGKPLRA